MRTVYRWLRVIGWLLVGVGCVLCLTEFLADPNTFERLPVHHTSLTGGAITAAVGFAVVALGWVAEEVAALRRSYQEDKGTT